MLLYPQSKLSAFYCIFPRKEEQKTALNAFLSGNVLLLYSLPALERVLGKHGIAGGDKCNVVPCSVRESRTDNWQ